MEGAASRLSLAGHVRLPLGAASGRAETSCAIPDFPAGRSPPHPAPIRGLSTGARPRSPVPLLASSPSGSECSALFRPLLSGGKNEQLKVRASSIPESAGESSFVSAAAKTSPEPGDIMHTLYLGVLFALWYLLNVYFYIYNKQVLKVYPFPMTITAAHLAMGTAFILFGWMSNLMKRPRISSSQLLAIVPLAIVHTLGNLFTNMSIGKVSVSFTHTIKAMEPFFTVVLSTVFLGEIPSLLVLLSLVPIAGGVALASLTEVSFNWIGFWSAMASNLANQSRNVLSKKFMAKKEESLDNITLFSIITIMSFFLTVPIAILTEGVNLIPNLQPTGLNLNDIYMRSLLAGVCFHAYQQVSYMILEYVSPVTHSVGNCVKRVVVIVASVLFFRTPVSPINALGTGVALAGVFSYSGVKRLRQKPKLA